MTFFRHRPQIAVFSLFFPNFPQKTACFSLNFSISSIKNSNDLLLVVNTEYTYFFTFFHSPYIHHCKNTLSSLHIFVHHCTFCASLHVKTCPTVFYTAALVKLYVKRDGCLAWLPAVKIDSYNNF